MTKEQANFRLDKDAKQEAYAVLERMGIKPTDAVNMLMHHIANFKELPFKPSVPNEETQKVMSDTDEGRNLTHHENVDDIFNKLDL